MEVGCALWVFFSSPSKPDLSTAVQSAQQNSLEIVAEMPYFRELDLSYPFAHLVPTSLLGSKGMVHQLFPSSFRDVSYHSANTTVTIAANKIAHGCWVKV